MKKLKFETTTVHKIDYREWDRFIKENFPKCPYYGIVPEEEMGNDSTFSYITGEVDQEDRIKTKQYLEGKLEDKYPSISTGDILNLLVAYEDIPEGLYNIYISW